MRFIEFKSGNVFIKQKYNKKSTIELTYKDKFKLYLLNYMDSGF